MQSVTVLCDCGCMHDDRDDNAKSVIIIIKRDDDTNDSPANNNYLATTTTTFNHQSRPNDRREWRRARLGAVFYCLKLRRLQARPHLQ